MRTDYTQKIVFVKDVGTVGTYHVEKLVGLVEPYIGTTFTAEMIQKFIDSNRKIVVEVRNGK